MVLCTYNTKTMGKGGSLGLAGHLPKCDHQVSGPNETPFLKNKQNIININNRTKVLET